MDWAEYSVASVYITTVLVLIFSVWAFIDSIREFKADRYEREYARALNNPLLIDVTNNSYKRALWFIGLTFGMCVIAVGGALFISITPPQVDTSWLQTVFRLDYIWIVFCAWSAKRIDRGRRRNARRSRESSEEWESNLVSYARRHQEDDEAYRLGNGEGDTNG